MSIATSASRKGMHSGPPATAPPGKLYDAAFGERGGQELRQRRVSGAPSSADTRSGASSPSELSGAASPVRASGSRSAAVFGDRRSPVTEVEEKVVVSEVRCEMSRRVYEMCIFVSSAAIILVFIGMLLFVVAFKEEIIKVIQTPIDLKPILKDLYCKTKLCRSFTREVISYINFSRDPCNEFYEYVCEGYLQEALNDRFKWAEPGFDYARLNSVLDGIYRRNVSDGPVWERKLMANNLWELASPLYERCMQGDAAAVDLPRDLDDYFEYANSTLSETLVKAYELIPLVDLVVTTAFPWLSDANRSLPTMEISRLRPLMDTSYVGAPSSLAYMSGLIREIWNGITPNNSIGRDDATNLAYIEASIAESLSNVTEWWRSWVSASTTERSLPQLRRSRRLAGLPPSAVSDFDMPEEAAVSRTAPSGPLPYYRVPPPFGGKAEEGVDAWLTKYKRVGKSNSWDTATMLPT
ncbi:hypothetical protein HPB51_011212 [Rhipicephalus microplus]|uniref:Peptidase M13 N-terminal domain-containing protein n=1 Tax=Rhipicephalus microplus TaxID=6941 RepID=A0A9J6F225_RHIMP|nr:hypothetical protein HPB51_011212 [Rhipicephalus microplus]